MQATYLEEAALEPELLRIQMDLLDMTQLIGGEAAEIAALITIMGQLRRAGEVPEDVRLVLRGQVGGLEVDALASA
jgi:hypothetical protein